MIHPDHYAAAKVRLDEADRMREAAILLRDAGHFSSGMLVLVGAAYQVLRAAAHADGYDPGHRRDLFSLSGAVVDAGALPLLPGPVDQGLDALEAVRVGLSHHHSVIDRGADGFETAERAYRAVSRFVRDHIPAPEDAPSLG